MRVRCTHSSRSVMLPRSMAVIIMGVRLVPLQCSYIIFQMDLRHFNIVSVPAPMLAQEEGPCQDRGAVGTCKFPIPYSWVQMCTFRQDVGGGWASYLICDEQRQQNIVKYVR